MPRDQQRSKLSNHEVEAHFLWVTGDACHSTKDIAKKVHSSVRCEGAILIY